MADSPRFLRWRRALALSGVVVAGLLSIVGSGGGGDGNCSFFSDVCNPGGGGVPTPVPFAFMQPPRVTAQVGSPASFTVVYDNLTHATLQWQRSADAGQSFVDIPGATGTGYTLAAANLADDKAIFRVVLRGDEGTLAASGRLAVSSQPGTVLEDHEFALADWGVSTSVSPAASAASQSATQETTGGNPGAWRRMVHELAPGPATLKVFHLAANAVYDPAAQGAVYVIDVGEDCRWQSLGDVDLLVATIPLIEQGPRRYLAAAPWRYFCSANAGWQPVAPRASLAPADFELLDGPACGSGESCPDFGATGAPLRFGYARVSELPARFAGTTIAHGIDNWKVTVWRH